MLRELVGCSTFRRGVGLTVRVLGFKARRGGAVKPPVRTGSRQYGVCAARVLHLGRWLGFLFLQRAERLHLVESEPLRSVAAVVEWDGFLVESADDFPYVSAVVFDVGDAGLGDGLFYPGALIVVGEVDAGGIE